MSLVDSAKFTNDANYMTYVIFPSGKIEEFDKAMREIYRSRQGKEVSLDEDVTTPLPDMHPPVRSKQGKGMTLDEEAAEKIGAGYVRLVNGADFLVDVGKFCGQSENVCVLNLGMVNWQVVFQPTLQFFKGLFNTERIP